MGQSRDALRAAAISIVADEAAAAGEDFHRRAPSRSAKRVLFWTQAIVMVLLGFAVAEAMRADARLVMRIALGGAYVLFAATIAWRLYAAASLKPLVSRLAEPRDGAWPVYTLLCPLYREAGVVGDLIAALDRLDYPRDALDVKLLIEADDLDTIAAAFAHARDPHIEIVLIPGAGPRTKPKALNVGLVRARGAFLAVYDAEDRPHPLQLRAALAAFEDGGLRLACVQAPLVVDNASASWITRQFAAEYAIQFRQILPLLARFGLPLPLGGSSNHFRTQAIREAGGWDAYNVTEDADLGYRLARDGWTSGVIAAPTWEEAPVTLQAWTKQRARWIKGHLHTWLVLMRDPIGAARDMGLPAFAAMQLVLGGGVLASFAHAPLAAAILYAILSPADILGLSGFILAIAGYCVGAFAALSAAALSGDPNHIRAAPTMPFYWPLATIAAGVALFELIVRPHHWSKTTHGLSPRTPLTFPGLAPRIEAAPARRRA